MVFDSAMKSLKKFCKDDDTCIFVILVLIGFLLCMFFNRDEGFASYPLSESDNSGGPVEGNHDYGGIGQKPTHANIEETIEPPKDPKMPQIAKVEDLPGIIPKDPGMPENIPGPTLRSIEMAKQGKQYGSELLPNSGGISVMGFSLDSGSSGVPLEYSAYTPQARYKDAVPSDLGPQFPSGDKEPEVADIPSSDTVSDGTMSQDTGSKMKKEMKLVLFYAPWCGHSRNMLKDYDIIMRKYNDTLMNGVTLNITKVDMEANKDGAEPYSVKIKGYPTLYTFVEENGKQVAQPFSQRDKKEIFEELQKRTKAMGSQ
jgi:thiol-disulfide isomerase/thioredoxin